MCMSSSNVSQAGPMPNYGNITAQTLTSQGSLAPYQLGLESAYQPAYGNVSMDTLAQIMLGNPGGTQSYSYNLPVAQRGYYTDTGERIGYLAHHLSGTGTYYNKGDQLSVSGTRQVNPTMGLLALSNLANSSARAADMADYNKYASTLDPATTDLMNRLTASANAGLDAGSNLTPEEQRAMQQSSRAAFAARGMGGGNTAIADELLRQFNLGQQLLEKRQQFGMGVAGLRQNNMSALANLILGRNNNLLGYGQQTQQQAGPTLFNPEGGLGLASSNYATKAQIAAATPTQSELFLQGMSGLGSMLGGTASGTGSAMGGKK